MHTAGDAVVAWLLALLISALLVETGIILLFAGDEIAHHGHLDARELAGAFSLMLTFDTLLLFVFGLLPFAMGGALLAASRTLSVIAYMMVSALAGLVTAALLVWVMTGDDGDAVQEYGKLLLDDLAGVIVAIGSAIGGLFAWWYLRRADARRSGAARS